MWCFECTSLNPMERCCHCRLPPSLWSAVSVQNMTLTCTHTDFRNPLLVHTDAHTHKYIFHIKLYNQMLLVVYLFTLIEYSSEKIRVQSECSLNDHPLLSSNPAASLPPSPAFSSRAAAGREIQPDQLPGQRGRRNGHHRLQLLPRIQGHLPGERPW